MTTGDDVERKTLKVEIDDPALAAADARIRELERRVEALEQRLGTALEAIVVLGECHPAYTAAIPREN